MMKKYIVLAFIIMTDISNAGNGTVIGKSAEYIENGFLRVENIDDFENSLTKNSFRRFKRHAVLSKNIQLEVDSEIKTMDIKPASLRAEAFDLVEISSGISIRIVEGD